MIRYHGLPIGGIDGGGDSPYLPEILRGQDAFVSFAHPCQLKVALLACRTVALDNGAFSFWRQGRGGTYPADLYPKYAAWAEALVREPNVSWAVVPDAVEGDEDENDRLIHLWPEAIPAVPVWHLHESLDRLVRLCEDAAQGRWQAVAFGSSGEYADPKSAAWWPRMAEAFDAICDGDGLPMCRLHGLRMMDLEIVEVFPFASVDSTNVGRNAARIPGYRRGMTKQMNAIWIAAQALSAIPARRWTGLPDELVPPAPVEPDQYALFPLAA